MAYIVAVPVVSVSVPSSGRTSQVRFVEEGDALPGGVERSILDHLVALGLVSEVPEGPEGTESEGTVSAGTKPETVEPKPATRGKTR